MKEEEEKRGARAAPGAGRGTPEGAAHPASWRRRALLRRHTPPPGFKGRSRARLAPPRPARPRLAAGASPARLGSAHLSRAAPRVMQGGRGVSPRMGQSGARVASGGARRRPLAACEGGTAPPWGRR